MTVANILLLASIINAMLLKDMVQWLVINLSKSTTELTISAALFSFIYYYYCTI